MRVNKFKPMLVNNYKELSNAIKKLYIEYTLLNSKDLQIKYENGVIDDNFIMSVCSDESLSDFFEEANFIVDKHKCPKHFFKRIASGNLIHCNFPAIVDIFGIIEMDNIKTVETFEMFSTSEYLDDNYSLEEICSKLKKNVYVYLGANRRCFTPCKKTKEEIIDFIKRKNVYFRKDLNDMPFVKNNNVFIGTLFDINECYQIIISNSAKNETIKKISDLFCCYSPI